MFSQNPINQEETDAGEAKPSPPPPPPPPPTLPPSLNPSPSHEFSFTISFHHRNCTAPPSQLDLAPAGDIFFDGHLLPLDKLQSTSNAEPNDGHISSNGIKSKPKPWFSSLLGLTRSLRRGGAGAGAEEGRGKKEKRSFDLRCCWNKRKRQDKEKGELKKRPCSFSGEANGSRERSTRWRSLGGLSAPASMWTSPTSSGVHVATTAVAASTNSEESTMVELQNAVQAAIAHCKNSFAINEDKFS